jgi:hypothetical protein
MEKYVYSMVVEVVAVVAIAVMAEQVPRPPLPGMLRGLEHLVRVTEPMGVVVPALPLRLIQVTLVVNRLAAGTPALLGLAKLVQHLRVLVGLLLDRAIREFLLGILLRPTGVQ